MTDNSTPPSPGKTLWNGLKCKCPRCGQANILKAYLKQLDECPACHEDLSKIRADDGPSWLAIFITGHIMAPIILYCAEHNLFDTWVGPTVIVSVAVLCCLLILPCAKGVFIAAIWLSRQKKTEPLDD